MKGIMVITGGAGFIGSNLATRYKKEHPEWRVISFDNLKRRGSELNLPRLKEFGVEFVHGDVRNREDLEQLGKFDVMIECSAEPSVLAGFNESPDYLINTNLMGAINCLECVRNHSAAIMFLSTSRVYPMGAINTLAFEETPTRFVPHPKQSLPGISSHGISETFPLTGARSLYGATKLAAELMIEEYVSTYGVRSIINRCGVIAGPWQMGKVDQGIMTFWIASHLYGKKLSYIGYGGKGKQVRDILHIDDLYRLVILQLATRDRWKGDVYNVGGGVGVSTSLAELTSLCQEITKKKIDISSVPTNRQGDIPYYVTDYRKVAHMFGWSPKKTMRDIVTDVASWIVENERMLKPILAG